MRILEDLEVRLHGVCVLGQFRVEGSGNPQRDL